MQANVQNDGPGEQTIKVAPLARKESPAKSLVRSTKTRFYRMLAFNLEDATPTEHSHDPCRDRS